MTAIKMGIRMRSLLCAIGVMSLGFVGASAHAGCGNFQTPGTPAGTSLFKHAAFMQVSDEAENLLERFEGISGVWQYKLLIGGAQIDFGTAIWHANFSEEMQSSRAPIIGYTCMGVWKQAGHATFKLTHFASNWTVAPGTENGAVYNGPTIIRETVTLEPGGNGYTGTFSITNYDLDGTTIMGPVFTGMVTAKRATVDF